MREPCWPPWGLGLHRLTEECQLVPRHTAWEDRDSGMAEARERKFRQTEPDEGPRGLGVSPPAGAVVSAHPSSGSTPVSAGLGVCVGGGGEHEATLLGQDRVSQTEGRLSKMARGTLAGRRPPPRAPSTGYRMGLGTVAPPSCHRLCAKPCLLRTVAGEGWCPTREPTPEEPGGWDPRGGG